MTNEPDQRGHVTSEGRGSEAEEMRSAAWARIREGLRRDVGARLFDQWLKQAELGPWCDLSRAVEIWLPSDFSANFVSSQFQDRLRLAWRAQDVGVDGVQVRRKPTSAGGRAEPKVYTAEPASQPSLPPLLSSDGFRPRHDFDSFIVGDSNRLAHSTALAMSGVDRPLFNPLYIHGGTGQGKTHLLHAIAGAFAGAHGGGPIIYLSAEKFMMEFVNAMRANATMDFKARLRGARLLLIDDVQFIAGKGSTQEELLHTLNELVDRGARIVISADRPPSLLDGVDARIVSRLAGGLVADIQTPTLELRLAILQARAAGVHAARGGVEIVPEAVIEFLARAIRSNVRELEGALNKLVAYAQLTHRVIDLDFAQAMLADTVRANARRITVDEIQKACAAHYRIEQAEMRSQRRARAVARPRQVAMYLAKKLTPRSLPEIGRIFGGRDHSTVIHAVKTIEALRAANPDIDADVRAIQRVLEG